MCVCMLSESDQRKLKNNNPEQIGDLFQRLTALYASFPVVSILTDGTTTHSFNQTKNPRSPLTPPCVYSSIPTDWSPNHDRPISCILNGLASHLLQLRPLHLFKKITVSSIYLVNSYPYVNAPELFINTGSPLPALCLAHTSTSPF